MGLRSERGKDDLPNWLLASAEKLVSQLDPAQYAELYRLASNARQQIEGSLPEWEPFERLLLEARVDRRNRNHATAVMLVLMPKVLSQVKSARFAAAQDAMDRLNSMKMRERRDGSEKIVVSTATSSSLDKGVERFALAL